MKIAFLGIGLMGFPMARRLCEAGHEVHVWNRTLAKAQLLSPFGAQAHATPGEAVQSADITITMLENGSVVSEVLFNHGTAKALAANSLVIDMSSIHWCRTGHAGHHGRRQSCQL
jgi:3-hydroxyisobutyrate dehydrogenase-like beta-hydroxyacid dehydrogenase